MDVSFVIVNWNTKDILCQCIESIYKTVVAHSFEIIVVDNNSSDGSQNFIASAFPSVNLIRSAENLGFGRANNVGMEASTGRHLAVINSDVILLEGCIDLLVDYMDSHADVGMAGPMVLWENMTLQESVMRLPTYLNTLGQTFLLDRFFRRLNAHLSVKEHNELVDVECLVGCFMMVRHEVVQEVGGFDKNIFMYAEEVDWCKRIKAAGWKIHYYKEARTIHLGGKSSGTRKLSLIIEMYKSRLYYWKKHHGSCGRFFFKYASIIELVLLLCTGSVKYLLSFSENQKIKLRAHLLTIKWLLFEST
jgi:GT2 family glycosyltransferase